MRHNAPYLYLRAERRMPNGTIKEAATWVIRDGKHTERTGCGPDAVERAKLLLAEYIARRHTEQANARKRRSSQTPVADVIAFYAQHKVDKQARPKEVRARLNELLDYFGDMMLDEINGDTCREFAVGDPARRRSLEDLRAAINYHQAEGKHDEVIRVVLPDKYIPRERWLTREEAAKLLRYCWRRPRLKHVAKFILVGLYTGTRASAICAAALKQTVGRGWVDLKHGVYYRRPPRIRLTKKRQPAIRLPRGLLNHITIWARHQKYVVEYQGEPVKRVSKAFRNACDELGMEDVVIHSLRHTAITWAMQNGADIWDASGFFGVSPQVLVDVYGHHHPQVGGKVGGIRRTK